MLYAFQSQESGSASQIWPTEIRRPHQNHQWPCSSVLICPQGSAVFPNGCTELFPSQLVGGDFSLSLPHFQCVIIKSMVYKQVQVRSCPPPQSVVGMRIFFMDSPVSKTTRTANTSFTTFGFSVLYWSLRLFYWETMKFDSERWPEQYGWESLQELKDLTFPFPQIIAILLGTQLALERLLTTSHSWF